MPNHAFFPACRFLHCYPSKRMFFIFFRTNRPFFTVVFMRHAMAASNISRFIINKCTAPYTNQVCCLFIILILHTLVKEDCACSANFFINLKCTIVDNQVQFYMLTVYYIIWNGNNMPFASRTSSNKRAAINCYVCTSREIKNSIKFLQVICRNRRITCISTAINCNFTWSCQAIHANCRKSTCNCRNFIRFTQYQFCAIFHINAVHTVCVSSIAYCCINCSILNGQLGVCACYAD